MGWNTYTQGPSANSQWAAPIDSFFDTFFSSPIHLFFLLHSVSFFQSDLMLVPRWAAHHLLRTITREPTKTKIFYICLTRNNLNNLSTMVLGIKRKSTKITNKRKRYFQQNIFRHLLTFFSASQIYLCQPWKMTSYLPTALLKAPIPSTDTICCGEIG